MIRDLAVGAISGAFLSYIYVQYLLPKYHLRNNRANASRGKVYLVGAGPGDPSLMTIRAQYLLTIATVVILDDLVSPEISALIPSDCEIIYVGKRGGNKDSARQSDIDTILVTKCREHHVVVRLKGGDPMVFGRVHSEIRALVQADCAFEVIPGISSSLAVPAVVHIPITHKEESKSFLTISLHQPDDVDFHLLAQIDTLVILMGTRTLEVITSRLMKCGRDPETPIALIHNGTLLSQLTIVGTLLTIVEQAQATERRLSPAIIVIGTVARYANLEAYLEDGLQDNTV